MSSVLIRPAVDADVAVLTAIYEHHVRRGTATFEIDPPTQAEMAARRADVLAKGLPYLVAEEASRVLGFAYCNWFKPRPAYRYSAEDSIYLHPDAVGKGLGTLLLRELMVQAQRAGVRKLIAVIGDSANAASIGVHKRCGFQHVGVVANCGWKFDQWRDIVLMDCELGAGASTSPT